MDLITAAREDLAAKTTDELHNLQRTDHTGLVVQELDRRRLAGEEFLRPATGPTWDEVIAQPNS